MSASFKTTPTIDRSSPAQKPDAGLESAQQKMTSSARMVDTAQRQVTVGDSTQRKPAAKPAWGQGSPNPITGRTNNPSNGFTAHKPISALKASSLTSRESPTPDKHANDRLIFVFTTLVGQTCTVLLKSGERFSGLFSAASVETSEPRVVLKMSRRLTLHASDQVNGVAESAGELVGQGADHVMLLDLASVVSLSAASIPLDKQLASSSNGTTASFRTDTDISGNVSRGERVLQKWEGPVGSTVDLSLDTDNTIGSWDQFGDNERKFGLTTDYDETFYTTALPTSNPQYKQWEAHAQRTAREIEGKQTSNAHVAEERGFVDDSGLDEESKYSGVARTKNYSPLSVGQPNKYTPPARRPPTGQPTVPGAPVDEAIISATIATKPNRERSPISGGNINMKSLVLENMLHASAGKAGTDTGNLADREATLRASNISEIESKAPAVSPLTQLGDSSGKKTPPLSSEAPTGQAAQPSPSKNKDNGMAATVEKDVVTAFKNFSATEKMRVVEHQRKIARHDKAVKLNDLKKFAENFKLHTPVPKDLIPILAKDKSKQSEIVQKNINNVADPKSTTSRRSSSAAAASTEKAVKAPITRPETGQTPPLPSLERQQPTQQRSRQSQGHFSQPLRVERSTQGPQNNQIPIRQGPGHLSQRLNINQQGHRGGSLHLGNVYPPGNLQDTRMPLGAPSASSSGLTSPTGNSRFNVKAMEFRPNPAASNFLPAHSPSNDSSPAQDQSRRQSVRRPPPGNFFEGRRPMINKADRIAISAHFNPIKRMQEVTGGEARAKDYAANLGIPQAYRTPPVWDVSEANQEKTYQQMFESVHLGASPASSQHLNHHTIAHHHQIPGHQQHSRHTGPMPGSHNLRHGHVQPTHHTGVGMPHQYDDHQMRFSQSNSGLHPSPRAPPFAYPNQVNQPLMYPPNGSPYTMSPSGHPMTVRQVSSGSHYLPPQGHAMGGHMMTNQPSNGPYGHITGNPPSQVYPIPTQVYPQQQIAQPNGPNGFPGARPMSTMMSHQGSQQGHGLQHIGYMQPGSHTQMFSSGSQGPMTPMRGGYPQQYGAPYNASPHQPPNYVNQPPRGTPSASYAQPMMPLQPLNSHVMPQGNNLTGPEDGK